MMLNAVHKVPSVKSCQSVCELPSRVDKPDDRAALGLLEAESHVRSIGFGPDDQRL